MRGLNMIEDKTTKIIILSIIFFLPLAGSIFMLIKTLAFQLVGWKDSRKSGSSRIGLIGRMALMVFAIGTGAFIGFFMVRFLWFPDYPLRTSLKIAGIVMVVPYLGCLGAIFGLNPAVEFGSSASKITKAVLFTRSKTKVIAKSEQNDSDRKI